jgi:hypothetical protein
VVRNHPRILHTQQLLDQTAFFWVFSFFYFFFVFFFFKNAIQNASSKQGAAADSGRSGLTDRRKMESGRDVDMTLNYYDILGVPMGLDEAALQSAVKKAYYKLGKF